jgi:lipopolysaccharide export system permease protein
VLKKLDKLILKAFIGPFVATFFITLFVLVMQFVWKYLDDMVGKGLDFFLIIRLIGLVSMTVIPLALPLAILLSSIMTFGNLGESYELVAIKSAGIPLLRFMKPLIVVTVFVCGFAFVVANYIIPVANLKFTTLLYDIRVAKPAFDIKEGIFYDKLPNYAIKVGKKDKDGNGIYDIVIYENDYRMQDNIIVAEKGRMSISPDKKFLEFYLQNGWRYQERGPFNSKETDFIRIGFKDYKKVFDLSSFELLKTPDSAFKTNWQMLNVKQLDKASDSMITLINSSVPTRVKKEAMNFLISGKAIENGWVSKKVIMPDSIKSYKQLLPDSVLTLTYNRSMEKSGLIKYSLDLIDADYQKKRSDLRHHLIEWHRKFALSFACMVLFFYWRPSWVDHQKRRFGHAFGHCRCILSHLSPVEYVWYQVRGK